MKQAEGCSLPKLCCNIDVIAVGLTLTCMLWWCSFQLSSSSMRRSTRHRRPALKLSLLCCASNANQKQTTNEMMPSELQADLQLKEISRLRRSVAAYFLHDDTDILHRMIKIPPKSGPKSSTDFKVNNQFCRLCFCVIDNSISNAQQEEFLCMATVATCKANSRAGLAAPMNVSYTLLSTAISLCSAVVIA